MRRLFDIFSKRERNLPNVYLYDEIPEKLRIQIIHIWNDVNCQLQMKRYTRLDEQPEIECRKIHRILCKEYGKLRLLEYETPGLSCCETLQVFFRECNVEEALDIIELLFHYVQRNIDKSKEIIAELNYRFRECGVGYQYESDRIVRMDSQHLHSEVVKPTLSLLQEKIYHVANSEFLSASTHYREGRYAECLNECLKAFESTMKVICDKRGWQPAKETTSHLIKTCFDNGLIPNFLQDELANLRKVLESGVPAIRNQLSSHGGGTQSVNIPEHVARYALNMTASNILFFVESEKALS